MEQVYLQIIREQAAYIEGLEAFIWAVEKDLREIAAQSDRLKNGKLVRTFTTKCTRTDSLSA